MVPWFGEPQLPHELGETLPMLPAKSWSAPYAVDGSSTDTRAPKEWAPFETPTIRREQPMQSISKIGLDIAKSVFQVHGVDAAGQVVIRRQLRRRHVLAFFQKLPPCLVAMEALRVFTPLVPRAAGVGAYGAIDAADLCEAACQEAGPPSVFFDLRPTMHKCDQRRCPSRRK